MTVLAFCLLCLLLTTGGCRTGGKEYVRNGYKVGPNYGTPEVEVAEGWIDYCDKRVSSEEPAAWDWWRTFNDPVLDSLIRIASQQNLTMQEASYRILEARSRRDMVAGNQLPQTQTLSAGMRNQQLSMAAGFPSGGAGGLPLGTDRQFNVWSAGPQVAWELDFWGRFRRAVEAADADLGAAVGNFDHVLVMLYSDVAATYVQIRIAEQRLKYAQANVEFQKRSLELAQARKEEGKACTLDISQATTNLSATEAIIPELEMQLRQGQNRLCVLLGRPPTDVRSLVEEDVEIPKVPPQLALGIPAELLRRRPDVRKVERELAAQSARIGIAEAELYPAFRINGSVFVQANQFTNLFTANALAGNIGPSFSWNIFNYGRLKKAIDVEEAKYMQKAAQYQSAVLNANREAEDALVGFLKAQDRARVLRKGVEAAVVARNLTSDLYEAGKADFGRVFFAEYFLVQQQDELAQAEGAIALRLIDLYRALGGGWQAAPGEFVAGPPHVAPPEVEEVPPPPVPAPMAAEKPTGVPATPVSQRPAEISRLPTVVMKALPPTPPKTVPTVAAPPKRAKEHAQAEPEPKLLRLPPDAKPIPRSHPEKKQAAPEPKPSNEPAAQSIAPAAKTTDAESAAAPEKPRQRKARPAYGWQADEKVKR